MDLYFIKGTLRTEGTDFLWGTGEESSQFVDYPWETLETARFAIWHLLTGWRVRGGCWYLGSWPRKSTGQCLSCDANLRVTCQK